MSKRKDFDEYNFIRSFIYDLYNDKYTSKVNSDEDFDLKHIRNRSKTYNDFLTSYVSFYKAKNRLQLTMRILFFLIIASLLITITISCYSCIEAMAKKEQVNYADAATAISALGSMLAAFFALPKIIAENLFPQKEDDISAELFNKMFDHDVELRKLHNENKQKSTNTTLEISEFQDDSDSKKE